MFFEEFFVVGHIVAEEPMMFADADEGEAHLVGELSLLDDIADRLRLREWVTFGVDVACPNVSRPSSIVDAGGLIGEGAPDIDRSIGVP